MMKFPVYWTPKETAGESSTPHALLGAIHTTSIVQPAYQHSKGCARGLFLQYIVCEVCTVCIEYKKCIPQCIVLQFLFHGHCDNYLIKTLLRLKGSI